jgi:hypothetical protein
MGGWGTTVVDDGDNHVNIPNKNVLVFNNLIYNPAGVVAPQHFTIGAPIANDPMSNAPSPAFADDGLVIRGNVIVNGDPSTPLGVDVETGCPPSNDTCNETQLRSENSINAFTPALGADLRPLQAFPYATAAIPNFTWSGLPAQALVPVGNLSNAVAVDRDGRARGGADMAGAYILAAAVPVRRRAAR